MIRSSADPLSPAYAASRAATAPASAPLHPAIRVAEPGPWFQMMNATGFEWTEVDLPIPGLPHDLDRFRILHLADLHSRARWDPAYDDLIQRVDRDPPDLIVNTGDFVDNRHDHRASLATLRQLLNSLKSRLGTVAILGNHDGDLLGPPLLSLNLLLVDHRRLSLSSGSATLELIGIAGVERRDLDLPFLRSLGPKPPNGTRIVLSHFPDLIRKTQFLHPDLFLAGHTHGGQICLPNGTPVLRHDKLPRHMCRGIHRAFNTWLIVNRGLGFSSIPFRIFCPAEIIDIRLRSA